MAGNSAPPMLINCFGSHYAEMKEDLEFFKKAFDHESALQRGVIQPHSGVDEEYDLACNEVASCESHINDF
ncbi:DNA mismatch repair protein [Meloidogyne graminicola]|uniref:DNA mismatch repair protein n=1 Tax=Meloidogyne graminicola TaxID=189291 RepID=A0A8T0A126_9BILA|nr:DNA mismatch repair protein [Meloidogyne graminicola]